MNIVVNTNMEVKLTVITACKQEDHQQIKILLTNFKKEGFEEIGWVTYNIE